MPTAKSKKKGKASSKKKTGAKTSSKKAGVSSSASSVANMSGANLVDNPLRTGMPAMDSVIEIIAFTPGPAAAMATAAPGVGISKYRILRTNEVDAYEAAPSSGPALKAFIMAAAAAPASDNFKGTARKAAKLSIAKAAIKSFPDLKDLIASLPSDKTMKALKPPIKTTATSDRVAEEKRNVRVRAFIYAASREDDNDYHLIIGRDPDNAPELYMTMELSGLPPSNSASFKKLKAARDAFKKFFASHPNGLPGLSYDFYDPPIPVEIEGSLYWDASHAKGSRPGPQKLRSRMPVVWEVHPISKMILEP